MTALFISCPIQAADKMHGPYKAEIIEVIDGDTVYARIHVWLGQDIETLIRLRDIDTPEIKGRCIKEKEMAQKAKAKLEELVSGHEIILHDIAYGKYAGRVLARATLPDGSDIAEILLTENLARHYYGAQRGGWC